MENKSHQNLNYQNLKKFKAVKLLSNSLKGKLQLGALVDPTVNTLNIFYLDTIEKQFKELGYPLGSHADHFVFSGIHDIRNLPTNIKHVINEKYKDKTYWKNDAKVKEFLDDIDSFNPFELNKDKILTKDLT